MTDDPLLFLALLACAAVLVVLLLGINAFRKGGPEASRQSNKFMQWRIGLQALAVVLILIFVFFRQQSGG
ncbi:twin transmembrane helix small protein [Gymnodinialimonas sp. 2305UL16-5]|uniref:twin transmembrane helix small protein n=1 Tax=Gymnodinialimonas mytili TaxID=3126503 RepID=UPI0030B4B76B